MTRQLEEGSSAGTASAQRNAVATAQATERATTAPSAGAAESTSASLQRHVGNAIISAALAGETVGPLGAIVTGSLAMDAAGVGPLADVGTNQHAMRLMRDEQIAPTKQDVSVLQSGGGSPLPAMTKRRMERAFKRDFSGVRVHTDAGAARAAEALNALAATLDSHIFFGSGRGAPGNKGSDRLLAHELTHVVQHQDGRIPRSSGGLDVSSPTDATEREAYANENKILGMLPEIDALFAKDAEVAKKTGASTGQLLERIEAAAGEQVPISVGFQILQALGKAADNGINDPAEALSSLDPALASAAAAFLPQQPAGAGEEAPSTESVAAAPEIADAPSAPAAAPPAIDVGAADVSAPSTEAVETEASSAGAAGPAVDAPSAAPAAPAAVESADAGGADQAVSASDQAGPAAAAPEAAPASSAPTGMGSVKAGSEPVQVYRSAFGKDRVSRTANMGLANFEEMAGVKGVMTDINPDSVLSGAHGPGVTRASAFPVIDAMTAAMKSMEFGNFSPEPVVQAGGKEITKLTDAAPIDQRGATALEYGRKGANMSLPFKQEILQELRQELGEGEGSEFEDLEWLINRVEVHVSPLACDTLQAQAFTVANVMVFRDGAPNKELVKHELMHVLQQGAILGSTPSVIPMTSPGDAAEVAADSGANAFVRGAATNADSRPVELARAVSIGESQPEVFNAVVQNAIPDGGSAKMEMFTSLGSAIQSGEDAVKSVINAGQAFPLDKVDALFSGDAFNVFDPNAFQTSLKPSGDNIVEEVVSVVMSICDTALAVLDGTIGIITEIMNVIEGFVQLLDALSNAMFVFGAILIGIGTGLIAVILPAGIGAQFVRWGNDLRSLGSQIKDISDTVKDFLEPLQEAIEKIKQVQEKIEKVREICGIIQECLDVYEWFTQDTSDERHASSSDMMASVERVGNLLGQLEGGKYQEFATKFWENSLPVVGYVLDGQNEVRPVDNQSTPAALGITDPGNTSANGPQQDDPSGVNEAFDQKKGERQGEGKDVYKDIVDPISWPTWFKPKPSDGIGVVLGFIGKGSEGDSGMADAPDHVPGPDAQGGGPGSGSSIVSGAIGVVGSLSQTGLNTESLITTLVEQTTHTLDLEGYPTNVAEVFEYLNNIIQYHEVADSLETQGGQRIQEARKLQENAQNSIHTAQNIIDISVDQDEAAASDEEAGHEGVGFMDYLMNLSQNLQGELQNRIQEMIAGQDLMNEAGNLSMESEMGAAGATEGGMSLGAAGGSIASMLAGMLIQIILKQLLPQLGLGDMLKNLMPEDMGSIMELGNTFIDMATQSIGRAVEKESEARSSRSVLNQVIQIDQRAQAQAQDQKARGEEMRATAEATLASAQQAESDGTSLRQQSADLDANLISEQTTVESQVNSQLSEAGPMRPRVAPQYVTPPDWPGVSQGIKESKDPGGTVTNWGPVPVSSDMGYPDPVAGPIVTQLLEVLPLPPVVSEIFSMALDAYRMFQDLALPFLGEVKIPTMAEAIMTALAGANGDQTALEQPDPILVGGGGGGNYDPGWCGTPAVTPVPDIFVTVRDFIEDKVMTWAGIERRAEDPATPYTPEAQVAQISAPGSQALADQEIDRTKQIRTAQGQIPTADFMYNTLKPLPSILPPQPAFADLVPMDTSGLGYNTQQIVIDGDVEAASSWISGLPTTVELLGAGVGGGMQMPQILKPVVQTAQNIPVPEYPELQLEAIVALVTPENPSSELIVDDPARYGGAADVNGDDGLLELKYADTLKLNTDTQTRHTQQETRIIDTASGQLVQTQNTHQSDMDGTLSDRDGAIRQVRDWLEGQTNQAIGGMEMDADLREQLAFLAMQEQLDGGRSTADAIMRQGEQTAFELQAKATADASRINAESLEKIVTMWGWFQEEISSFTQNVSTMLSQLWNSANNAVEATLAGAQGGAMNTLLLASDNATQILGQLGSAIPGVYSQLRGVLDALGIEANSKFRRAIDQAAKKMLSIAQKAAKITHRIVDTAQSAMDAVEAASQGEIGTAWTSFDEFVEKLRAADVIAAGQTRGQDELVDPAQPVPNHPSEDRNIPDGQNAPGTVHQPVTTEPGSDWPMPAQIPPAAQQLPEGLQENVAAFVTATPTEKAEQWPTFSERATQAIQEHEGTFQGGLDPLLAQMGGEVAMPGTEPRVESPGANDLAGPRGGALPEAEITPTPQPSSEPVAREPQFGAWSEPSPETDARPNASQVAAKLNEVPVHDPTIVTSPGVAPMVPLRGAADPTQLGEAANEAGTRAQQLTQAAMNAVQASPGPELVTAVELDEVYPVDGLQQAIAQDPAQAVAKMDEYLEHGLPADVSAQFDTMWGPEMEGNLGVFQGDMDGAEQDRDTGRAEAILEAETEARKASEQAHADQLATVAQKRDEIIAKRQETVEAQQAHLDTFSADARARYAADLRTARTKVDTTQTQVNQTFVDAQKKAEAEVAAGEARAEREKRKAEQESENQSWWRRALNWVKSAINKLTSLINDIFDKVRQAVTQIIDLAKLAAKKLIDLATTFLKGLIEAFGAWLKLQINLLVGTFFPELAQELTEFVDATVAYAQSEIDGFAENLKGFVDGLLDKLKGVLDGVLAVFQAAVNVAIGVAYGVLTGDWMEGLRMAMDAVLELAGIDPGEFYALLSTGADVLTYVLRNPGSFVGNVIDAVGEGFGQFAGNFLEHVKNGFIEWATPAALESGLKLPEEWSARSVFASVADLMGLDAESMRTKALDFVGEENAARFAWVWSTVDSALDGGIMGLYDHVKDNLPGMYEGIVDTIQQWLMMEIAEKAAMKIISMFTPVGALVQAVITAWDMYQFVKSNIEQIWAVVQSVVDNFQMIAMGSIAAAANGIEQGFADLIPLAIDLLARVFGLSGSREKVHDTVASVQGAVDSGIDTFLGMLSDTFPTSGHQGHHDSEKPIVKHEFGDSFDNSHELYMSAGGQLMESSLVGETTLSGALTATDHLFNYMSGGAKGTVQGQYATAENAIPAIVGGDHAAVDPATEALAAADALLAVEEMPSDPEYIDPERAEAAANARDDANGSEGTEPSGTVPSESTVATDAAVVTGAADSDVSEGAASELPGELDPWKTVQAGFPWDDELKYRDEFLQHGGMGGGSTEAVFHGMAGGFTEAAWNVGADLLTETSLFGAAKFSKWFQGSKWAPKLGELGTKFGVKGKLPGGLTRFLGGYFEVAQFAMDPKGWLIGDEGQGSGVWGGAQWSWNNVSEGIGKMATAGERLEGFVQMMDGIGKLLETVSKVLWFLTGLCAIIGAIGLLFFGAGAALLAWATTLGTWANWMGLAATAVGLVTTAFRLALIGVKSVEIEAGAGDPGQLLETKKEVQDQTKKATQQFAERAAARGKDYVNDRINHSRQVNALEAQGAPTSSVEPPSGKKVALDIAWTFGMGGTPSKYAEMGSDLWTDGKNGLIAAVEVFPRRGGDLDIVERLEKNAGLVVFTDDADREFLAQLNERRDTDRNSYLQAQNNYLASTDQLAGTLDGRKAATDQAYQMQMDYLDAVDGFYTAPDAPSGVKAAGQMLDAASGMHSGMQSARRSAEMAAEDFAAARDSAVALYDENAAPLAQAAAAVEIAAWDVRVAEAELAAQMLKQSETAAQRAMISAEADLGMAVERSKTETETAWDRWVENARQDRDVAWTEKKEWAIDETYQDLQGTLAMGDESGAPSIGMFGVGADQHVSMWGGDTGGATGPSGSTLAQFLGVETNKLWDGDYNTSPSGEHLYNADAMGIPDSISFDSARDEIGAIDVPGPQFSTAEIPEQINQIWREACRALPMPPLETPGTVDELHAKYADLVAASNNLVLIESEAVMEQDAARVNLSELDLSIEHALSANAAIEALRGVATEKMDANKRAEVRANDVLGHANRADTDARKADGYFGPIDLAAVVAVVPSRWVGDTAGGPESADALRESSAGMMDGASMTQDAAKSGIAAVLEQYEAASGVHSGLAQDTATVDGYEGHLQQVRTEEVAFEADMVRSEQDAASMFGEIQAEKQRIAAEHEAAVAEAQGWTMEHGQMRMQAEAAMAQLANAYLKS